MHDFGNNYAITSTSTETCGSIIGEVITKKKYRSLSSTIIKKVLLRCWYGGNKNEEYTNATINVAIQRHKKLKKSVDYALSRRNVLERKNNIGLSLSNLQEKAKTISAFNLPQNLFK